MSQRQPEFSERPDRSEIKDERQRATGRKCWPKCDSVAQHLPAPGETSATLAERRLWVRRYPFNVAGIMPQPKDAED